MIPTFTSPFLSHSLYGNLMYSTSYLNTLHPNEILDPAQILDVHVFLPYGIPIHTITQAQHLVVILDSFNFCHCLYPISLTACLTLIQATSSSQYCCNISYLVTCLYPCLPVMCSVHSMRVTVLTSHNDLPCTSSSSWSSRPCVILYFLYPFLPLL